MAPFRRSRSKRKGRATAHDGKLALRAKSHSGRGQVHDVSWTGRSGVMMARGSSITLRTPAPGPGRWLRRGCTARRHAHRDAEQADDSGRAARPLPAGSTVRHQRPVQATISVKIPLGSDESPKLSVGAPPVPVTPAAVSTVFSTLFTPETEPSPPLPS